MLSKSTTEKGWDEQWRCSDLLRKKQMQCLISILYCEGVKHGLENAPPLPRTAIKAPKREKWLAVNHVGLFDCFERDTHTHTNSCTLTQIAFFALHLHSSSLCLPVIFLSVLLVTSRLSFNCITLVLLLSAWSGNILAFPAGQNWQVYFPLTTCHLGWVSVNVPVFILCVR